MKTSSRTNWHKHRGLAGFLGLLALLVAYGFACWAIDSGRLLAYGLTIAALISAGVNFKRAISRGVK